MIAIPLDDDYHNVNDDDPSQYNDYPSQYYDVNDYPSQYAAFDGKFLADKTKPVHHTN